MYYMIYEAKKRMTVKDVASISCNKYRKFVEIIFNLAFDETPDYQQLI